MTIVIKIKTDNSAFENKDAEVGRLVHVIGERIRLGRGADGVSLQDLNGNTVGSVTVRGK